MNNILYTVAFIDISNLFERNHYILAIPLILALLILLKLAYKKISNHNEIKHYQELILKYPNYADLRAELGNVYLKSGQYNLAIEMYEEALKIYKYFNYARLKLAVIYLIQNNLPRAFEHLYLVIEHEPTNAVMINTIDDLLKEQQAEKQFQEYVKTRKNS